MVPFFLKRPLRRQLHLAHYLLLLRPLSLVLALFVIVVVGGQETETTTASSSSSVSRSDATVRELTSLLLKGQTLLLAVAEKQQMQRQGRVESEDSGSDSSDDVSPGANAVVTPQTSTRLTFDTLAYDKAEEAVNAVLSNFLTDLALGGTVSAQMSEDDDDYDELSSDDNEETGQGDGGDGNDGGVGGGGFESGNTTTSTSTSATNTGGRGRGSCLPSLYASPTHKPPKLLGGALAIVFNGGECRVVRGFLPGTRKVECDSPSIEYALVPPGFEWSHESPEMWAGQSCDGEITRCGGVGTTTSFANRVDVPIADGDQADERRAVAAQSEWCRAASKDSLIDSTFEEDAVNFKALS